MIHIEDMGESLSCGGDSCPCTGFPFCHIRKGRMDLSRAISRLSKKRRPSSNHKAKLIPSTPRFVLASGWTPFRDLLLTNIFFFFPLGDPDAPARRDVSRGARLRKREITRGQKTQRYGLRTW